MSCTSNTACTAVGYYYNTSEDFATLAETWNGATWSIQTTPNPIGATSSSLYGVSCRTPTACTAVGSSTNGTLAETWNGTAWSIQTAPTPTGAIQSVLSAVSCTSATTCTADGTYANLNNNFTLAEHEHN